MTGAGDSAGWLSAGDCRLDDFIALVSQKTEVAAFPLASEIVDNVVVYRTERLSHMAATPAGRHQAQAELARVLLDGPGIVVFQAAFENTSVVDEATAVFAEIIEEQRSSGVTAGDHFAKPGANDRIWNALEKLAIREPEVFAAYYGNDIINLVSIAWLGTGYQLTSQINVVNPGGAAQTAHRDYHLGFMSKQQAAAYPKHVHRLSPGLTLQGAVAHSDMPIETGPTLYLPHSHKYEPGYLAFHLPEFSEYFERSYVQLPLEKGDAVFFNPAVFHGAGHNRSTDVRRMANLLQVSSPFGRAMESVDRARMATSVFPVLRTLRAEAAPESTLRNVIAATAEGYAFPTNLDQDQPVDGLAPETQADLLWRAVDGQWPDAQLTQAIQAQLARRSTTAGR